MQAIPIPSQPEPSLGLHSRLDGSDRFASSGTKLSCPSLLRVRNEGAPLREFGALLSPYPAILSLPRTQTIKDDQPIAIVDSKGSRQSYVPLVLNNDKVNQRKTRSEVAWVGGAISGTIAPTRRSSESRNGSTNPQRREALRVGFDLNHIECIDKVRSMVSPQPRFLSPLVGGFISSAWRNVDANHRELTPDVRSATRVNNPLQRCLKPSFVRRVMDRSHVGSTPTVLINSN